MYKLKDHIFNYFGLRDKVRDLYKDVNGDGLHERFNKLLAGDLDDEELDLINYIVENTQNPKTLLAKFLGYREATFNIPIFSPDEKVRRKVLLFISEINRRRGTKSGYEILLNLLGYGNVVITEYLPSSGFDSPVTFDDIDRRFDEKCKPCSKYSVSFEGVGPLTSEALASVMLAIEYNEPINAVLENIVYNNVIVNIITIYVDNYGDLWYDNGNDPGTTLDLDSLGDLILNSSSNYYVDDSGDFIYKFVT